MPVRTLTSKETQPPTEPQASLPSLSDLIPAERIALNVEASDWREAIRISGKLLLDTGAITPPYIDAMLEIAEELEQYIVITHGIALPHARPEDGAIKTALSLVKLRTPLYFGNPDHDPVTLVIGLAAIDKKIHVRALQTLAKLLLSDKLVKKLMKAASREEIYSAFEQAEAEDDE